MYRSQRRPLDMGRFSAFSALQAARGRKSRGGGRPGLGEPWIAEGISRRTWFRRRARERERSQLNLV